MRAVKNMKPEIFERKYRHKVNDNRLKRNLAISHRKVGKLIGGFLASFGEESEYLSWDYTNRLQEIEEEMEAERKRQEEQKARASNNGYRVRKIGLSLRERRKRSSIKKPLKQYRRCAGQSERIQSSMK